MKNNIFLFLLLSMISIMVSGQNANSETCTLKKQQNRDINLCNHIADSISYEDLKNCNELLIDSDPQISVTSYTLLVIFPGSSEGSDLYENTITENKIPSKVIDEIISKKAQKIFFEDIRINKGDEKKSAGYRGYIFK